MREQFIGQKRVPKKAKLHVKLSVTTKVVVGYLQSLLLLGLDLLFSLGVELLLFLGCLVSNFRQNLLGLCRTGLWWSP